MWYNFGFYVPRRAWYYHQWCERSTGLESTAHGQMERPTKIRKLEAQLNGERSEFAVKILQRHHYSAALQK